MANEYTLKGKLQAVIPGTEGVIELGDIEVPIRLDFGTKQSKPGMAMRGVTDDQVGLIDSIDVRKLSRGGLQR